MYRLFVICLEPESLRRLGLPAEPSGMLTRKQHELLRFIHDRLREDGVPPSFDEMKEALDLRSKSGIHRLIMALEERGFIRRLPNRARAIEVVRMPEQSLPGAAAPRRRRGSAGHPRRTHRCRLPPCVDGRPRADVDCEGV